MLRNLLFEISVLFYLNILNTCMAQNNETRILDYPEFVEEMLSCKAEKYILVNAVIKMEGSYDEQDIIDSLCRQYDEIEHIIYLSEINFENSKDNISVYDPLHSLNLRNIKFKNLVKFDKVKGLNFIKFDNCQFDEQLDSVSSFKTNKTSNSSFTGNWVLPIIQSCWVRAIWHARLFSS